MAKRRGIHIAGFPDFASCPSRHTHTGGGQTIQATFMAYIDR